MNRRRSIIGSAFSAAIVSSIILLTALGLLAEDGSVIAIVVDGLIQIAAVVAAFGVLVGVLNLLVFVHLRRLLGGQSGALYSFALIATTAFVVSVYIADQSDLWGGNLEGEQLSPRLFEVTQVTLESALAGIVLFALVYGAYRLMRRRFNWSYLFFLAAMLIALTGWLPMEDFETVGEWRDWLLRVPVTAGTRGLLLGVALGTVALGIRLILAQERFYQRRQ